MPQYNNRTFSRQPNNMQNASDYINRRRAQGLYTSVASNRKGNERDDLAVLTRIGPEHSKCVFSVGGFNVNSYSLLLDITKGRYFTATDGRVITVNHMNFSGFTQPQNQIIDISINNCPPTDVFIVPPTPGKTVPPVIAPGGRAVDANIVPINQTSDLFEGNFIVNKSELVTNISDVSACNCIIPNLYDLPGIGIDTTYLDHFNNNPNNKISQQAVARWGNKEPLRGFRFPSTRGLNLPI